MLGLLTHRCAFASTRLRTFHADALTAFHLNPSTDLTAAGEKPSSQPKAQGAATESLPHLIVPPPSETERLRREAEIPPPFDLVTTHFFLDCFSTTDLALLIPAVRARLTPGALWVVSEFRVPPTGPLRLPARILVRLLYLAFRMLTGLTPTHLPDYASLLRRSGLFPVSIRHSLAGLLTAELWQLPPASHSSPADPR